MDSAVLTEKPFSLRLDGRGPLTRRLFPPIGAALERLLGFSGLNELHNAAVHRTPRPTAGAYSESWLACLGASFVMRPGDLERIPPKGPLVIVANHPYGAIDGVILYALLHRIRSDVKSLSSYFLGGIPQLRGSFIFVDPFRSPEATERNRPALRTAIRWVDDGGALIVFPAGEVSHLRLREGRVADPPWSDTIARIILRSRATVLPVFFAGKNSGFFQACGLLHSRLRTALLAREVLNKRGVEVRMRVGSPIPASRLRRFDDPAAVTAYLHLRTLLLGGTGAAGRIRSVAAAPSIEPDAEPFAAPTPHQAVAREVRSLFDDHCLVSHGPLHIICAPAPRIPHALREIGRLREITFREVGEGTGRSLDLDCFDEHYLHMFLWDEENERIAGAYRLGLSDQILGTNGLEGLYTYTLFRFDRRLLAQLGPSIELGRSFVVPGYQRNYAPLMLLWKGICRFVARHPQYRRLFGAVSISAEYETTTKRLLMSFLNANRFTSDLSTMVEPRNPPRLPPLRRNEKRLLAACVRDIDDVDELVRDIEADGRPAPILLRQYLKLNAKLLGFNVDPDFGNVIDGLMLVDLTVVNRAILDRYFGVDAAAGFLAFHRNSP